MTLSTTSLTLLSYSTASVHSPPLSAANLFLVQITVGNPSYLSSAVLKCTLVVQIYNGWRCPAIALTNKQTHRKCSATPTIWQILVTATKQQSE